MTPATPEISKRWNTAKSKVSPTDTKNNATRLNPMAKPKRWKTNVMTADCWRWPAAASFCLSSFDAAKFWSLNRSSNFFIAEARAVN